MEDEAGDDSTPTVTLADGSGSAIAATGSTGVNPTTLTLTFDRPMNPTTVTTAGNVTFVCGDITPAIAVGQVSETVYAVTVTDPYKYQLLDCILTVTTHVEAAEGTTVAADTAFTFTNGCAVDDDFNTDSQACWTVWTVTDDQTWTTWPDLLSNVFTFNTAAGTLDYSDEPVEGSSDVIIFKTTTLSSSAVEIILHLKGLAGFDTPNVDDSTSEIGIALANDVVYLGIAVKNENLDGEWARYCQIDFENNETNSDYIAPCPGDEYYLRLYMDSSMTQRQYSTDGATYADLLLQEDSDDLFPSFDTVLSSLGSSVYFLIGASSTGSQTNRASIEGIVTTGVMVSGHY